MPSQRKDTRSPTAAAKKPSTNDGSSLVSFLLAIVAYMMRVAALIALFMVLVVSVLFWSLLSIL